MIGLAEDKPFPSPLLIKFLYSPTAILETHTTSALQVVCDGFQPHKDDSQIFFWLLQFRP